MSYPQGYLYQAPGSLALYSCPAYGASALAAPRSEELARSASGSAFSPYPGSAAFTAQAATGFGSPLQYSADAAAAAAGFPSYMVTERGLAGGAARCRAQRPWPVIGEPRVAGNVVLGGGSEVAELGPWRGRRGREAGRSAGDGRSAGLRAPFPSAAEVISPGAREARPHWARDGIWPGWPSFRRRSWARSLERAGARFFRRGQQGSAPLGLRGDRQALGTFSRGL